MKNKEFLILIRILAVAVIFAAGWLIWNNLKETPSSVPPVSIPPEPQEVTITTDKTEYEQGETVKIAIENKQDAEIDICCPIFCAAVGSFPTRIEKYEKGEWEFSVGYCPIFEPLFEKPGVFKDDFVCHKLSPKSWFELEIYDFYEGRKFDENERVRILYYFGKEKTQIYSSEFTIKEKKILKSECKEKSDGTSCNAGLWYDEIGRACGG